ncbi:MAG: hypothetical protein KDI79_14315 [Anaerolineae bacterium]|nr:hypothetical protein [Anaerolineae bacterium]
MVEVTIIVANGLGLIAIDQAKPNLSYYANVKRMTKSIEVNSDGQLNNLSRKEMELLQRADRGTLPCPRCNEPLSGHMLHEAGVYQGVLLLCLTAGCGFREY